MKRLIFLLFWLWSLVSLGQVDGNLKTLVASGTDTYTINEALPPTYTNNERFFVRFTNANSGAATLNRATLGAKAIQKAGAVALTSGDIVAGGTYLLSYNGTYYQIVGDGGSGGGGGGSGTVTSVAALTLGTTGTDLSSSVANGTTTPVITLNVPTASAANRGALSSTDWSTFNGKQPLDSDLTTIAGLTATTDNFIQSKSSAWASRTPAQVKADLNILYLPLITGYLGSSGSDASMEVSTAVDRIPTTSMSVGQRITAIVTISGTQRRLYNAELVVPADATANIEVSPSVIRPNDFNAGTNNKVWREIRQNGLIDVSNYGVVPGAIFVSDQIIAIMTAAATNDALIFPPGDYNVYAMTVTKKLNFIGYGARFISPTVDVGIMNIQQDGVTVKGFDFIGQGKASIYTNQRAIRISNCSNVRIEDCLFDGYRDSALSTNSTHISDTSSDFGGINVVNCIFMRNNVAFHATTRGEYVNIVGCSIVDNNTGLLIGAGNINVQGCQIIDSSTVGIDLITGVNDAHGVITGNQINHNVLAFRGVDIVNGEFIRDNNIYYGNMEFTDSNGLVFTNNTIEGAELYFDNCTGIQIEGNTLPNSATTTLTTNWNGNASTVFAFNNKTFANEYLSGWNFSDIGTTGQRVTKGWFTDLQVTNAIAGSVTGNAATVTTNANLTGHVTSSGNATSLGSFTVAELSTAISDANISGTNTGDQTSIVGITGTTAQFNTALSDGDFATGGGTASGTNTGDQSLANTSDATSHTVTLTGATSVQLIEGSNITLTTGGTGSVGTVTIASTGGGASALDDLTDVVVTSVATNQVLQHNGSNWVNTYYDRPVSVQSGTTYTLVAADQSSVIYFTAATPITVTLPNGLADNFACVLVRKGAGTGTITLSATTTLESDGTTIEVQHTGVEVIHRTANVWTALGSLGAPLTLANITGTLDVDSGGTGAATLTGVVIGDGTSAMTAVSGTASQYLRRNAGNTAYEFATIAAGSFSVTETELDFGSFPVSQKSFTVTDAGVSGTSKIMVTPSGNQATDRVGNDYEFDIIQYSAVPGTGSFTVYANSATGPITGKRKIFYTFN